MYTSAFGGLIAAVHAGLVRAGSCYSGGFQVSDNDTPPRVFGLLLVGALAFLAVAVAVIVLPVMF